MFYDGEALASVLTGVERVDATEAGVSGARGFAFPLSVIETALAKRFVKGDAEPRLLEVRDATGRPLEGPSGLVSPAEFLRLSALSCAVQLLLTNIEVDS